MVLSEKTRCSEGELKDSLLLLFSAFSKSATVVQKLRQDLQPSSYSTYVSIGESRVISSLESIAAMLSPSGPN